MEVDSILEVVQMLEKKENMKIMKKWDNHKKVRKSWKSEKIILFQLICWGGGGHICLKSWIVLNFVPFLHLTLYFCFFALFTKANIVYRQYRWHIYLLSVFSSMCNDECAVLVGLLFPLQTLKFLTQQCQCFKSVNLTWAVYRCF